MMHAKSKCLNFVAFSSKHSSTTYISKTTNAHDTTFKNKTSETSEISKAKETNTNKDQTLILHKQKRYDSCKTTYGKPEETTTPVALTHLTFGSVDYYI